jgi:hypothetical protein
MAKTPVAVLLPFSHHHAVARLERLPTLHGFVIERIRMARTVVAGDGQRGAASGGHCARRDVDSDGAVVLVRELDLHSSEVGETLISRNIGQSTQLGG